MLCYVESSYETAREYSVLCRYILDVLPIQDSELKFQLASLEMDSIITSVAFQPPLTCCFRHTHGRVTRNLS
jgi:hypothetical protein